MCVHLQYAHLKYQTLYITLLVSNIEYNYLLTDYLISFNKYVITLFLYFNYYNFVFLPTCCAVTVTEVPFMVSVITNLEFGSANLEFGSACVKILYNINHGP